MHIAKDIEVRKRVCDELKTEVPLIHPDERKSGEENPSEESTKPDSGTVDWGSYRPPPDQMCQDVSDNRGLSLPPPIGQYKNNLDWDGMFIGPEPLTEVPQILPGEKESEESVACDSDKADEEPPPLAIHSIICGHADDDSSSSSDSKWTMDSSLEVHGPTIRPRCHGRVWNS